MAKEFFQEKGIEYTEYDVAADMDKRKEMVEKTGQLGVPVIEIDGQATVGFDKDKIEALL